MPSYWKGYLKLSLVTCAVSMTPATTMSERVRFHTVNRETGNRIRSRYVDSVTREPVEDDDQVMGYPVGKDEYVLLDDDELDAVALESVHTIDVDEFVPRKSVDRIWLDAPHYLAPADKVGQEAFAVIRDAMAAAAVVGLSRLVLQRREHRVMIEPRGKGILVWTLRYRNQVRPADDYFDEDAEPAVSGKGLELAHALIEERTRDWGPDLVEDRVQKDLKKLIASKKARKGARTPAPEPVAKPPEGGAKVISIMDALRRSVEAAGKPGSSRTAAAKSADKSAAEKSAEKSPAARPAAGKAGAAGSKTAAPGAAKTGAKPSAKAGKAMAPEADRPKPGPSKRKR